MALFHGFRANIAVKFFVEVFLLVSLYPEELTKNAAHKQMLQRHLCDDLEKFFNGDAQSTDRCQSCLPSIVKLFNVHLFVIEADKSNERFGVFLGFHLLHILFYLSHPISLRFFVFTKGVTTFRKDVSLPQVKVGVFLMTHVYRLVELLI